MFDCGFYSLVDASLTLSRDSSSPLLRLLTLSKAIIPKRVERCTRTIFQTEASLKKARLSNFQYSRACHHYTHTLDGGLKPVHTWTIHTRLHKVPLAGSTIIAGNSAFLPFSAYKPAKNLVCPYSGSVRIPIHIEYTISQPFPHYFGSQSPLRAVVCPDRFIRWCCSLSLSLSPTSARDRYTTHIRDTGEKIAKVEAAVDIDVRIYV